VVDRNGI